MSVRHTEVTTPAARPDQERAEAEALACGVREVLDRLGDRWSVPVIIELGRGVHRFRQLQRALPGVSQRMLTLTLRRLERDALVTRTVYPTVPAQVEYALTATGGSLTTLMHALAEWASQHGAEVVRSRDRWDGEQLRQTHSVDS